MLETLRRHGRGPRAFAAEDLSCTVSRRTDQDLYAGLPRGSWGPCDLEFEQQQLDRGADIERVQPEENRFRVRVRRREQEQPFPIESGGDDEEGGQDRFLQRLQRLVRLIPFREDAVQLIVRDGVDSVVPLIHQLYLAGIKGNPLPALILDSEDEGERPRGGGPHALERVRKGRAPRIVGVKFGRRESLNRDGRSLQGGNDQITLSSQVRQTLRART